MNVKTILHPTDHSESSKAALRFAVALAHDYAARLLILHVLPPGGTAEMSFSETSLDPAPGRVGMEYLLGEGEPVATILRTAAERHCDLIVMGRDGGTGWRRWFQGSRAEQIIRKAPCPVLVVKEAMSPHAGPAPAAPAAPAAETLPVPAGR
jgi:nucleotide-binding universal stress UspA family protein